MNRNIETEAFVLRTVDYGESHLIVTMIGRDVGKFSAMARSAKKSRKRFGGALLPLRKLRATVTFRPNRDLANFDHATVEREFPGIESSYEKITVASYATELVRCALRDHDEANTMFDVLFSCYERLSDADESSAVFRAILHHFELAVLTVSGAAPTLGECHRCGAGIASMQKVRCSRSGHGIVCADCVRPGERYGILSPDTLDVLHYLEAPTGRPPDAIANDEIAGQVRRVLDASLEQVLDAQLHSRALLDTVLGDPEDSRNAPRSRARTP